MLKNRSSVEAACAQTLQKWGRVDILVNAAGGNSPGATATDDLPFFDLPQDALSDVMELNLLGTMIPSQVFGQQMAKQKEGSIINISSVAATQPLSRVVGYAATKSGVENFTRWLAVYMAKNASPNIRVNAISPGAIPTELERQVWAHKLEEYTQFILDHQSLKRRIEPQEIAQTVHYLCCEASSGITGQNLSVDGGWWMH